MADTKDMPDIKDLPTPHLEVLAVLRRLVEDVISGAHPHASVRDSQRVLEEQTGRKAEAYITGPT